MLYGIQFFLVFLILKTKSNINCDTIKYNFNLNFGQVFYEFNEKKYNATNGLSEEVGC